MSGLNLHAALHLADVAEKRAGGVLGVFPLKPEWDSRSAVEEALVLLAHAVRHMNDPVCPSCRSEEALAVRPRESDDRWCTDVWHSLHLDVLVPRSRWARAWDALTGARG